METARILRSLVFQTGVLAGVTVGTVYRITHSGLLIVILTGLGVLVAGLSVGVAGPAGAGTVEASYGVELGETMAGLTTDRAESGPPLRLRLAFYGFGLTAWGLVILLTLRHALH